MPQRNRNQWRARHRRKQRLERLLKLKVSLQRARANSGTSRRVKKIQIPKPVPAPAVVVTATAKPQSVTTTQVQQKTYKIVLTKGPEDEDRDLWIECLKEVFGKTEKEAKDIIDYVEWTTGGAAVFSSTSIREVLDLRNELRGSLKEAINVKESE